MLVGAWLRDPAFNQTMYYINGHVLIVSGTGDASKTKDLYFLHDIFMIYLFRVFAAPTNILEQRHLCVYENKAMTGCVFKIHKVNVVEL